MPGILHDTSIEEIHIKHEWVYIQQCVRKRGVWTIQYFPCEKKSWNLIRGEDTYACTGKNGKEYEEWYTW